MLGVYEDGLLTPTAKEIDKQGHGFIRKLFHQGIIQGTTGETLPLFHVANTGFEHILLIGCGKHSSLSPTGFRKIMVGAAKALSTTKTQAATCYLTEVDVPNQPLSWKVRQIVEACVDGLYCFDLFKTEKKPVHLKDFIIHLADNKQQKACDEALAQGLAIASGSSLTKNLANLPSNICTPTFMAEQAKDLGKTYSSLKVTVLEEKEMQKLGMGALLAVSQGSAEDAKLICLEYNGGPKKRSACRPRW